MWEAGGLIECQPSIQFPPLHSGNHSVWRERAQCQKKTLLKDAKHWSKLLLISLRYYFMLRKNLKITKSDAKHAPIRLSIFGSNEARIALAKNVSKNDKRALKTNKERTAFPLSAFGTISSVALRKSLSLTLIVRTCQTECCDAGAVYRRLTEKAQRLRI